MNVSEIISRADSMYPNVRTEQTKINDIDNLNKRLHRKYKIQAAQTFELLSGVASYPTRIRIEDMFSTTVNGTEYPPKQITASAAGKYVTNLNGYTVIYPTPTEDGSFTVYYYGTAETVSSVEDTPSIDSDYHMLFVYWLCKLAAEENREFDHATGFVIPYNDLEKDLAAVFQDPEVKTITSESGW